MSRPWRRVGPVHGVPARYRHEGRRVRVRLTALEEVAVAIELGVPPEIDDPAMNTLLARARANFAGEVRAMKWLALASDEDRESEFIRSGGALLSHLISGRWSPANVSHKAADARSFWRVALTHGVVLGVVVGGVLLNGAVGKWTASVTPLSTAPPESVRAALMVMISYIAVTAIANLDPSAVQRVSPLRYFGDPHGPR